jgi:hypothetical protein
MKLVKRENDYCLYNESEETIAASWANVTGKKLSQSNCDEIFGVIDVEKLANELLFTVGNEGIIDSRAYIKGFNKAIELNKDKVFTEKDIKKAIHFGVSNREYLLNGTKKVSELFESLQQPTEIEVEIEMVDYGLGNDKNGRPVFDKRPILDSNGCLILRKL